MSQLLHDDVLMSIFIHCRPGVIGRVSKYWYYLQKIITEKIYVNKVKEITTNYQSNISNQIDDIYEMIMIHENLQIGSSNDLTIPTNEICKYDYNTISFWCRRRKMDKLYNYRSMDNRASLFCSISKDYKCVNLIIFYLISLFIITYLLNFTRLDVKHNTLYYINNLINQNLPLPRYS